MKILDVQLFIIKRLIQTGGLLVRNGYNDLPFWYTSGRPGPFYVNTQNNDIDVISGGERRDWFFSIPVSIELELPHIFLFKNGLATQCNPDGSIEKTLNIKRKRVLHVSDIINLASSYFKSWLPIL